VNAGQSGFYRVRYSADISKKLTAAITSLSLKAVDRIGIQSDAFALAVAGLIPTEEALILAQSFVNEKDPTVWTDLITNLHKVSDVWADEPNYADYERFHRNILQKIGQELGWDAKQGESSLNTVLRQSVLNTLGIHGDQGVINEAKARFNESIANNKPLIPDIRGLVYKFVVQNGGEKEYEQVYKIFKEAEMHEEKLRALRALGATENAALAKRTLNMAISDEVRSQDIIYVVAPCANSRIGKNLTWNFMKENFGEFEKRLKDSMMLFERVLTAAFDGFTSEEKAVEVEQFFKEHPVASADRGIKQSLEVIRGNAKWLNTNRANVAKFLSSN